MNKIPLCNDYLHHFVLSFLTSGLVQDLLTAKFKLHRKRASEEEEVEEEEEEDETKKERKKKEKVERWLLFCNLSEFRIQQSGNTDK